MTINETAAAPADLTAARPIAHDITDLIGNTPLLDLDEFAQRRGAQARLIAKVEFFNPLASVKDRIAWAIIREAEKSGELRHGQLIVDITSGNTGVALAAIATSRGYPVKFYLGDNTSPDKRKLLETLGAELVTVPNSIFIDPEGLANLVEEIEREHPEAYFTNQLGNPSNPEEHYRTTGPEIWRDTEGAVDAFVAGVGTGGTVSGAGRYLREQNPEVRIVVAEPGDASLPTVEEPYPSEIDGVHKVAELEDDQLPPNYDREIADEIISIEAEDAYAVSREVLRETGLFVGASAGAIIGVALQLAQRDEFAGKTIVAVVPDSGERYLSAGVFG
jgi:cysteine synthase A